MLVLNNQINQIDLLRKKKRMSKGAIDMLCMLEIKMFTLTTF